MSADQLALPLTLAPQPSSSWHRPKGKAACRRVPEAGPGSCWHWWEGCPEAEKRGCYQRWRHMTHGDKRDAPQ